MRDHKEEEEEEAQAEVERWKYVFGFTNMAVVKCAVELELANAIENHHQQPITLSQLSSTVGCDPSNLYRIMRFLIHHSIFKEVPTSQGTTGYAHTPLSRRLLGRGDGSLADFVLLESSPVMLAPWHLLSSRVQINGAPAFGSVHGDDVWKYAEENPGHSKLIDDAMACHARVAISTVIKECPVVFDGIKTLVDVGGGNGTTLGLLVKAFPEIKGINFDLPHVISTAHEHDGVTNVGGDMFQCVPKADAAFLMQVLHDWDDNECISILKKCKEAISEGNGKVIIVEIVVGEAREDKLEFARLMLDMVMMAHTNGGKERTSEEWRYVLREAGFRSHAITRISAVQSIIEAFP